MNEDGGVAAATVAAERGCRGALLRSCVAVADGGTALMLLFADADLQWRCWNVNGGRREGEECAGLARA